MEPAFVVDVIVGIARVLESGLGEGLVHVGCGQGGRKWSRWQASNLHRFEVDLPSSKLKHKH